MNYDVYIAKKIFNFRLPSYVILLVCLYLIFNQVSIFFKFRPIIFYVLNTPTNLFLLQTILTIAYLLHFVLNQSYTVYEYVCIIHHHVIIVVLSYYHRKAFDFSWPLLTHKITCKI